MGPGCEFQDLFAWAIVRQHWLLLGPTLQVQKKVLGIDSLDEAWSLQGTSVPFYTLSC